MLNGRGFHHFCQSIAMSIPVDLLISCDDNVYYILLLLRSYTIYVKSDESESCYIQTACAYAQKGHSQRFTLKNERDVIAHLISLRGLRCSCVSEKVNITLILIT
ncbi:hypothetical protein CVS40_8111 [Lucilia cuprina]|nr:hypothetical protein CVS40_8111 [Lucilia cuprina]